MVHYKLIFHYSLPWEFKDHLISVTRPILYNEIFECRIDPTFDRNF